MRGISDSVLLGVYSQLFGQETLLTQQLFPQAQHQEFPLRQREVSFLLLTQFRPSSGQSIIQGCENTWSFALAFVKQSSFVWPTPRRCSLEKDTRFPCLST